MSKRNAIVRVLAVLAVVTLIAAACSKKTATPKISVSGSKGGTLKLVSQGDVDFIDPGQSYYTFGYNIDRVTERQLMSFPPGGLTPIPDAAAGQPQTSADFRTWTFKIRTDLKFGPPVNRAITSQDFAYAIERQFNPNVGGQYIFYLDGGVGNALTGAKAYEDAFTHNNTAVINAGISGLTTPDSHTLVMKFDGPRGDISGLVSMPAYAPVPADFAKPLDAHKPSTYGSHQIAAGPYMFKNDGTATGNIQGSGLGWDANKKIILVRNQNWVESTDPIRKAFPDQIEIDEGYNDPNIATQDILNGQFDFNYDFQIPPAKSQSILSNASQKPLLHNPLIPGLRYISLNTTIHPFTSVHVRRAVAWILNKDAMRKTRGGAIAGPIATHVLSPNLAGFKEAGGNSYDPYATTNEQGDLQKALAEMKLAATQDHEPNINASTGMYTGPAVLMVGSNTGTAPATTTEVANDLKKIGINTRRADYTTNTMYTEWAQIPGKNVAILPNVAWVVDYPDTFTMLAPILGGPGPGGHFPSVKNNNYSLFNDPTFNGLVKDVSATQDVAKRNKLFGELDQRTMDQVPIIPWLWSADALLTSPRVKNFVYYALGDSMDLAVVAVQ